MKLSPFIKPTAIYDAISLVRTLLLFDDIRRNRAGRNFGTKPIKPHNTIIEKGKEMNSKNIWLKFVVIVMIAVNIAQAQTSKNTPDFEKKDTLYCVSTAHLDTQWRWTIQETIQKYILDTLEVNFKRFDEVPEYTFSFEGAFRYMLMKEYYPELYERLKTHIDRGQWRVAGSSVDAGDVNVPSPESLIRHALYGNNYFRKEFGKTSKDIFLPDCFGFGYVLPTVMKHCGIKGFSTQKLTWGGAIPIPFEIGRWEGVDGSVVVAALNPGKYVSKIERDLSDDPDALKNIEKTRKASGLGIGFKYFGVGDRGGGPDEKSVSWLKKSMDNKEGIHVISTGSDQLFRDLTPAQIDRLPLYRGELLMRVHGAGCYTSQAAMKRWNRKNELLADGAERAAVVADWLGGADYPQEALTDSWIRFLWHQFHDDLTGTSIPEAYTFSWNDEILSLNRFASILSDGVGAVARALDTRTKGTPVLVFNPLSVEREDVVQACIPISGKSPAAIRVFDPRGKETPCQVLSLESGMAKILFLARMPSLGFAVYDIQASKSPSTLANSLKVTKSLLENEQYRVLIDANGDVSSITDKASGRELLKDPIRLELLNDVSTRWPAWEIIHEDVSTPPREYVSGPAKVRILEKGPVRVSLEIVRERAGSTFLQEIRLAAGEAGAEIEFRNEIDWNTKKTLLKAAFPLTASNPKATYDLGIGTIERGVNTEDCYEVPAQQWADLTDKGGDFGVAILNDCKYGWDKPDDHTLRLTLLHTPGVDGRYNDQANLDLGHHEMTYAVAGHAKSWSQNNRVVWQAARLNQPLLAFVTESHIGSLGKFFSFAKLNSNQVAIRALKQAENSDEIVIRLQELAGKSATGVEVSFAGKILAARELTGAEEPLGEVPIKDGCLLVDMKAYQPRTIGIKLDKSPHALQPPRSKSISIEYDTDVVSLDTDRSNGQFGEDGYALSGDLLPKELVCEGIQFKLGPARAGAKNALTCRGQILPLGSRGYDTVYLLAASAGDNVTTDFKVGDETVPLTIHRYTGFIGQWDSRVVDDQVIEDGSPVAAYIKNNPVAWIGTHRHTADGKNDPYRFTYLYKYSIPFPSDAKTLVLPNNPSIRIMAVTLADNPNAHTQPACHLYDRAIAPMFSPSAGIFDRSIKVSMQVSEPGAEIRYTTDGTEPGLSSPLYTSPFTLTRSTFVKAKAFRNGREIGRSTQMKYTQMDPREPDNPSRTAPGLRCEYYEGEWDKLPDFSTLTPVKTSVTRTIDLEPRKRDYLFALRFSGFIDIKVKGLYVFETRSDDGSCLWIGDVKVVDNDGLHGGTVRKGRIYLKPGRHAITVAYFQKRVAKRLNVSYKGPGIFQQSIPESALLHTP